MLIEFNKHGFEVTEGLRNATTKKFEKLQRHFDRITRIIVNFHIEGQDHVAEATVHVPGNDFHARERSNDDMYAAIDLLTDNLDRQIVKHKEKLKNHKVEQ